jgi:hypothetical protein
VPLSSAVRKALKLAEGTALRHGDSPFAAGASVVAATHTRSLPHTPHRIEISKIPANRLSPVCIGSHFRKKPFPHLSCLNTKFHSFDPTSPHHHIITSSSKYHESRSITIVRPPITTMGDGVIRLSPLFPSDVIEER